MQITVLSGGVGGARFLRGLVAHCAASEPADITVIGNTGDDITLYGLRVCPDLDSVMYTLGGAADDERGWGRAAETTRVAEEMTAYGAGHWFTLGDLDLATHLVRSHWLAAGMPLSEVTARLAERFGLAASRVTLIPVTDHPIETHVLVDREGQRVAMHFQEWWVRYGASLPAHGFPVVGLAAARPAPGVLEAIAEADVVLLPPSNPVVSLGIILSVPGVREALRATTAPVVGVSPLVGGAPVRGHADRCLSALGLPATSSAVAGLYADLLSGWLVAPGDEGDVPPGVVQRAAPLLMRDGPSAAALAGNALALAQEIRGSRTEAS